MVRSISRNTSKATRTASFTNQVRNRDRGCVCLGIPAKRWTNFDSAHIVPLAFHDSWTALGFEEIITEPAPGNHSKINSIQNGILLSATAHRGFDMYGWSISVNVFIYPYFKYLKRKH